MIDIKINNSIKPTDKFDKNEVDNINKIFNQVDELNLEKQKKLSETPKPNNTLFAQLKKQLKIFCVISIIGLVVFGICMVSEFLTAFSNFKDDTLAQYSQHYAEISQSDNNSLTVEEYYQKKAMLLLTKEDLEHIFDQSKNVAKITNLLNLKSNSGVSLLPQNKQKDFESVFEEFKEYISSGGDPNALYGSIAKDNEQ